MVALHTIGGNTLTSIAWLGGAKLKGVVGNLLSQVSSHVIPQEDAGFRQPAWDFVADVERARQEWLTSKIYFETVSDPDLVDHAIHLMAAAEKRYMYLLRRAREQGIRLEI